MIDGQLDVLRAALLRLARRAVPRIMVAADAAACRRILWDEVMVPARDACHD